MASVKIQGWGVAAACCADLLNRAGFAVFQEAQARAGVPAILISAATQTLICDIFQRPDLFHGLRQIERRVVAWGPKAEPVVLPHSAVVISEEELIAGIQPQGMDSPEGHAKWTVFASQPLPESAVEWHFGTRRAVAVPVELKSPEESACWVESLESGWLFLIPGWLIAVGGSPDALLGRSHVVEDQIRTVGTPVADFPAYPRIADPLCAAGWLACGSAAMAFDPICGDGTGNAMREAVLASAIIRAAARGEDVEALLEHYRARLLAGFRRHLEISLDFYRAGNSGPWWVEEIEALERGLAWCTPPPAFRYRLEGFELVRI